jgi:hypothetical protein
MDSGRNPKALMSAVYLDIVYTTPGTPSIAILKPLDPLPRAVFTASAEAFRKIPTAPFRFRTIEAAGLPVGATGLCMLDITERS